MKVLFVDLDSTLCDTRHRHHLINREDWHATDWIAYSMACTEDTPIEGPIAIVRAMHDLGVVVHIISGRSAPPEVITLTKEWLHRHRVPYEYLTMRPPEESEIRNGDFKRREIEGFLARHPDAEPVALLDDWPPVADALGDLLPVLLVNPNYYESTETRDDSETVGSASLT